MADKESLDKLNQRIEFLEKELSSIKSELSKLSPTNAPIQIAKPDYKPNIIQPKTTVIQEEPKPGHSFDWEVLLGGNILGKLGLSAILLAFIWFIKFAFDNHWINESGRIFIGLGIGFSTIATGLYYAKRKMRIVPESIIGTGISIVYLSLYGAYYYYDLINAKEAFAAFTILSVGTSILAGRTNLQVLYIFSLFGSILAPVLLSSGENSYRFLFVYLTLINLVFYYISQMNSWRVSPYLIFLANCIIFSGWADKNLTISSPIPPLLYLSGMFITFSMREIYLMPRIRKSIDISSPILVLFLVISFSGFGFWVVEEFYPNLTAHFLLVESFLLVGFLKLFGKYSLSLLDSSNARRYSLSTVLFLSWVAILFAAISNFSQGRWIAFSWILFAGGLSAVGAYFRNKIYIGISIIPWTLALLRLYFVESLNDRNFYFIFNTRFGLFALATAFLLTTYQIQKKDSINRAIVGFVFTALFTLILGTLVEVHYLVSDHYYRNLGYSYVIGFYMIALLIPGFKLSYKSFRITGIILGVILVSKFYLYDIWMMSVVVRIIAGFSLGIGLVVLSIVYQKYKDKINVNQILKLIVFPILLFAFLPTDNLSADPFKNSGYKYFADIKGLTKEVVEGENNIYGRVRLTEEISRFHGTSDLRLVYKNELVPFFQRRVTNSTGKTGKTIPTVVYNNVTSNGRIYVLKFEEPPAKTEYTEIEIAGTEKYETGVYVSLGDEPNDWKETVSASIYNYYDDQLAGKINRIKFRSGKYRYARLEFDSKIQFEFTGALYSGIKEKAEYKLDIKLEDLSKSIDSDKKASVYEYENSTHRPISRIVLNFEEAKYQRSVEILQKDTNTKEFISMADTVVYKKSEEKGEHNIDLPSYQGGNVKILVFNREDKPLTLKSVEAYSEMEEIVFEIPKATDISETSENLVLYYGNEYVRPPEFDLKTTYDEKLKHTNFKLGEHKANPEFAYSMVEPPLSSWIIRAIFALGLLLMAYPAFTILKQYRTELDSDKIMGKDTTSEV
jgi:hypothetical protein